MKTQTQIVEHAITNEHATSKASLTFLFHHRLNFESSQQAFKQPPPVANFRNQQTTPSSKDIDQTIELKFSSNFPIKQFSR